MIRKLSFSLLLCLASAGSVLAVPDTVSLRVTDVTTSSFAVVWMTDVAAVPNVEVYADSGMTSRLTDSITLVPMPDAPRDVAAAARGKGIMKIRVSGLAPGVTCYVRSATADPSDPASIGYSALQEVATAAAVKPYRTATDGTLQGVFNNLVPMKVHIRPGDTDAAPGQGDLILLETPGSPYPVSAFVGAGVSAPEGILDLNNLFGTEMSSLYILGGEKSRLTMYRGGAYANLVHYRKLPINGGTVAVREAVKGFFADVNLDGKVDEEDFAEFRKQYRGVPDDLAYNPDFNFFEDPAAGIDAHDFARFAKEYGRSDVQ